MNIRTGGLTRLTSAIWYISVLLALAAGWSVRGERYLIAESGIGYWLGIIGGSMMLLLLIYPLRKRFIRWAAIGSVKSWFRIHMILGLAGPVAIIFHSGFRLGSFNSSIAFVCMVIVASSGLVGRSLYRSIHHGLYGRKIRFDDLYASGQLHGMLMGGKEAIDFDIVDEFERIQKALTGSHTGDNRSLMFYRRMKVRIGKLRKKLRGSDLGTDEKRQIQRALKGLHSICVLGINEILFSYWHVLHLPLFVMLILTGFIHVAVVHLY
ncbi:MAG: hypothetical protein PVI79_11285 [Gammaproteobacteria bacterium]|jgi:hypothetical protein